MMKAIAVEKFSTPNDYVYFFIKRVTLIQNILDSLSKEDVVHINKTVHKLTRRPIFGQVKLGSRSHPDTFDWRTDKDFVTRLLFCTTTFNMVMVNVLSEIRGSKFNPNNVDNFEIIIKNAYKAPEAVIYNVAVLPSFVEYKGNVIS